MIFPQPSKALYSEGRYTLLSHSEDLSLVSLYGFYKNGNDDLTPVHDLSLGEDAYSLSVGESGITVRYGTESGKFRAITTLRQLIVANGEALPFCEIEDRPQFARRGYMLDISSARIPKLDTLKRLVDLLAELKYNELQLYMESFCYKFPHFPQVTEGFDCLTPADMEELDAYCAERFIDLVPNQNCFGHMAVWLAHKDFAHLGVGDEKHKTGTLNILLPETEAFVEQLFDSVLPYFRSQYVNIGLDEAFGLGKYQLEEICKDKGKTEVFMWWLGKVSDMIRRKYGKTVMFWSDMVYEAKNAFHLIPEGAVALNWNYDLIDTALSDRRCAYLEEKQIPFYVCPGTSTWVGFTGRFDLLTFNLRTSAEFGANHGARGYLLTDWGEHGTHYTYPVFSLVPLALGAQYAWNIGEYQDGYRMKHPFTDAAQKFIDEYVFEGKRVSHLHYKLSQTYLLEPKRIHCSSIVPFSFSLKLSQYAVPGFFDLRKEEPFYFENVICYLQKILAEVEKSDFDENLKLQTILCTKFYLLGAELCIVRMKQSADAEQIDRLVALIDEIVPLHRMLWMRENFEGGIAKSMGILESHRTELLEMKAAL